MTLKCELCNKNATAEVTDAILGQPIEGWRARNNHSSHAFCDEHQRPAIFYAEPPDSQAITDRQAFSEWCHSSLLLVAELTNNAIKAAQMARDCIAGVANEMSHMSKLGESNDQANPSPANGD